VFAIRARTREGASASICRADRRFRGVVEMPSHGPGLRDHIYFFFQPSFFSIPFFFPSTLLHFYFHSASRSGAEARPVVDERKNAASEHD